MVSEWIMEVTPNTCQNSIEYTLKGDQSYSLDVQEYSEWYGAIILDNTDAIKCILLQAAQHGQNYKQSLLWGSFTGDQFDYYRMLRRNELIQRTGFQYFQTGKNII